MASDLALAKARALAERERRKRQSAPVETPEFPVELGQSMTPFEASEEVIRPIGDAAAQVNEGVLSLLPRDWLVAIHEKTGAIPHPDTPKTITEAGLNTLGQAAPLIAGAPVVAARMGQQALNQVPSTARRISSDLANTARRNPRAFYGSEAAAAFGAGALEEAAQQTEGMTEGGKTLASVAGGLGGGFASALPNTVKGARQAVMANLAPMSNEGGMIRTARQVQDRAGGRSAEFAERLDSIPEGVTPAQWIGDERLMAQEARLLQDDSELQNIVRAELETARLAAQKSLEEGFGKPWSRQDWELDVLKRVSPDGTAIKRGQTDEMLDQAYQGFKPLYDTAKGHQIDARGLDGLMKVAARDEEIIATDQERSAIEKWLSSRLKSFAPKIEEGEILSDDLLELRSKIRDERRLQSKRGNLERADLLGSAETEITRTLENGLPQEAVETLALADSKYRIYKVVENAVYQAGDETLTPQQLSNSIRQGGLASQGQYARGTEETVQDLRRMALQGRSTEEALRDPLRAKLLVRDQSPEFKQAAQADFVNVLMDRSKSPDANDSGIPFISGSQLKKEITENKRVFSALGMTKSEISRLNKIASEISALEKKSPKSVAELFEDGPASLAQLVAALLGAQSGQRIAGGGLGSSMVMAQYMSNKSRGALARLTSDEAERLMSDAVTDPKLYKALLTKDVTPKPTMKENAQYLEAWLLNNLYDKAVEAERSLNQEELPQLPEEQKQ